MNKLAVSPLTLGTVQLGMPYGVANRLGKPDEETSFDILRKAINLGITALDTSRHYGIAEEVIGSFLKKDKVAPPPLVVSKFKWSDAALTNVRLARREAIHYVKQSLAALGIGVLPVLLYHKGKDQPMSLLMKILPGMIGELKAEGYIKYGGISLYHPKEAAHVYDEELIAAVQVPYNVLDQRLLKLKALQHFYESGKIVFVRSIFLQGLLLMDPDKLPVGLQEALPYMRQLRAFAEEGNMDIAQLAFSYVRDTMGVSSIVFGADNTEQVAQNVRLFQGKSLPEYIRAGMHDFFRDIPERLLTPGLW